VCDRVCEVRRCTATTARSALTFISPFIMMRIAGLIILAMRGFANMSPPSGASSFASANRNAIVCAAERSTPLLRGSKRSTPLSPPMLLPCVPPP